MKATLWDVLSAESRACLDQHDPAIARVLRVLEPGRAQYVPKPDAAAHTGPTRAQMWAHYQLCRNQGMAPTEAVRETAGQLHVSERTVWNACEWARGQAEH